MKKMLKLICVFFFTTNLFAQPVKETKQQKEQRMKWWEDARFGLFIHWGLYSVPAGEWNGQTNHAEWIRTTARIPMPTYEKFVQQFNPVKFNADEWVSLAKQAGMKYIVITTKHHDGFCMFNSEVTDFDIMSTPFHRDIIKELSVACAKQGIRLCFYHSIMDWHHPDYLPRREWEKDRPTTGANFSNYVTYLKKQLLELLTKYGKIGILWFDGEWENTWTHERGKDLYKYVRELQPGIIINNRVDVGRAGTEGFSKDGNVGDYGTPEQEIPATGIPGTDWESCMTMNNNWGYNSHDNNWKSTAELIYNLVDIASKGGNFLLNVGPTSEGVFPASSIERLKEIGSWMNINSEAIYGTQASPFKSISWGKCTQKAIPGGTRLYLHVFRWPFNDGKLIVPGLGSNPTKIYALAGNIPLKGVRNEGDYIIDVSSVTKQNYATVIVVDVKGKPVIYDAPDIKTTSSIFIDQLPVTVTTKIPGAEIRYTINDEEPTMHSPLVKGNIVLKETATFKAKCFIKGKAVTESATLRFAKVVPAPAVQITAPTAGLDYAIYEGKWDELPDFSTLKPVTKGVSKTIDISSKQGAEEYGFVFDGYVNVPANGVYTFYISSDDGSKLYIDDDMKIDNDGLHGMTEKNKEVPLAKGYHHLQIGFFERSGGDDLKVYWSGPGIKKSEIPAALLFHK